MALDECTGSPPEAFGTAELLEWMVPASSTVAKATTMADLVMMPIDDATQGLEKGTLQLNLVPIWTKLAVMDVVAEFGTQLN